MLRSLTLTRSTLTSGNYERRGSDTPASVTAMIMDACFLVSRRKDLHIHAGIWASLFSVLLALITSLTALSASASMASMSVGIPLILNLDIFELAFCLRVVIWIDSRALLISSLRTIAQVESESVGVWRMMLFLLTPSAIINLNLPESFWLIVKRISLFWVSFGRLEFVVIKISRWICAVSLVKALRGFGFWLGFFVTC